MLFACAAAAVYLGRWCPEKGANWLSQLPVEHPSFMPVLLLLLLLLLLLPLRAVH
jgi:hypothetical protein